MFTGIKIFTIIIFIVVFIGFGFGIVLFFSPKLRGWMMSKHVKATKHMMDNSKEDIQSISSDLAQATQDGVEITSRAIKNGFQEEDIFCKYCGQKIDSDSVYCSKCGKKL